MIKTTVLRHNDKPTKEQIKRIEQVAKRPVTTDKDSPDSAAVKNLLIVQGIL